MLETKKCSSCDVSPSVLFLNQVAGSLFRELAEACAVQFGGADLLTGHTREIEKPIHPALRVHAAPDYDRRSIYRRGVSWLGYFFAAARHVWRGDRKQLLFIVSNPPFLPVIGWLAALIRGQSYCVLVYDLYPGVLVQLGRLSARTPLVWLWRRLNLAVWRRAEVVFTIGDHMVETMRREAGPAAKVNFVVIPNWADVDFIRPLEKQDNAFLQSLGWGDRAVVLYAGNLGNTHNLDGLLHAAELLKVRQDLGFLIIGNGARWNAIERRITERGLDNVRLLPFQPESLLPQTLPAGDIAVVSMERALAGYMVPSKTYYSLAAGSALLALVPEACEVADLVTREQCGLRVEADDVDGIVRAINELTRDRTRLAALRRRAREVAVAKYSRANAALYAEALQAAVHAK